MAPRDRIKLPDGDIRLPNARVSQFPRAPGRLMGPGTDGTGKPGSTPPEDTFYFGPIGALTFRTFTEVFRRVVKGFSSGKLLVSADVVMSSTTFALRLPQLYADIKVVGYTNGVPEVIAYGATGMSFLGTVQLTPDEGNMDAPPVLAEWDDPFAFDEISVNVRTMGNGGSPLVAFGATNFTPSAGDAVNLNIAGKLWR